MSSRKNADGGSPSAFVSARTTIRRQRTWGDLVVVVSRTAAPTGVAPRVARRLQCCRMRLCGHFQTLMSRDADRQHRASIVCWFEISICFPESPIPSRVLIAIGPSAPPWGQLHCAQCSTAG
jgi:hypothetical protein